MKTKFEPKIEHTAGAGVGHPCRDGIYDDPIDRVDMSVIEAASEQEAEQMLLARIRAEVAALPACECHRHAENRAGTEKWWNSVSYQVQEIP